MDHLLLHPTSLDHLTHLLHRTTGPAPPTLAPGSRTAAALDRAADLWRGTHRRAEADLRDHLSEVRTFAGQVATWDREMLR